MKYTVTFETEASRPTGPFLLHVVVVLHQLRINPVKLTWAELAGTGRRLWILTVQEPEDRLLDLLGALNGSDGVRNARIEPVEVRSAAPFEAFERTAFTDWSI